MTSPLRSSVIGSSPFATVGPKQSYGMSPNQGMCVCPLTFKVAVAARQRAVIVVVSEANEAGNCLLADVDAALGPALYRFRKRSDRRHSFTS